MSSILIIDDNDDILDFLSDILTPIYVVYSATNAKSAREMLTSNPIDLIISDIMMPGMDGFELCRLIKSDVAYSHIPVLLLTSKNTYTAQLDGLKVGADAYINKPFQIDFLQLQIANLLSNRQQVKRFFSTAATAVLLPSKTDSEFVEKLNLYIKSRISHFEIDINHLAAYLNMSRPTLYRKVRSIFNLSPKEIIHESRVKHAAELIALNHHTLKQVRLMVGYRSPTVFGRKFKKHFKVLPSEYLMNLKSES